MNPVLVLYLGVGGYGVWASAIAIASLFGFAGDLGVSAALTKFIAEREGKKEPLESFAASALIFGLAAGVTTGLTLGAVSLFFKSYGGYSNFGLLLALQALQMPFAMGSATLLGIFQGRRLFRPLALLTMIQSALGLVLTIGLLANGQGLIGVMIASASGAIAFFGILLALNWKSVVPTRAGDFVEDFRKLVPFGIRLTATNALSTVLYQIDIVILALVIGDPVLVGTYALAVFVTRAFWIIPGSISTTTYPVTSQYAATNDWRRVSPYLPTPFVPSVAIVGILGSGLVVFARPVLGVVFGSTAIGAYEIALILLGGTGALGCLRAIAASIPGVGRPEVGLRISAVGAVCMAIVSLIFTEFLGMPGTALAVSVCFGLVAFLLIRAVDNHVLGFARTRLVSHRVVLTATVAIGSCGICYFVGLPENAGPAWFVAAGLLWAAISVCLGVASGGRKTWGDIFRIPSRARAERD